MTGTSVCKPTSPRAGRETGARTKRRPRLWTRPSDAEEFANALTHGLGWLLSVFGAVYLVSVALRRGEGWLTTGCVVYAGSLVAVYTASTLSHLVNAPRPKWRLRMIDQGAIYLLIVGTFTPFALAYLCRGEWWLLLLAMWVVALGGFSSKLLLAHRVERVSTATYVLLGWIPLTAVKPILVHAPAESLAWALAGGLCYTLGTLFLALDCRYRYFHAVWHSWVIAGSLCHYLMTLFYVVLPVEG